METRHNMQRSLRSTGASIVVPSQHNRSRSRTLKQNPTNKSRTKSNLSNDKAQGSEKAASSEKSVNTDKRNSSSGVSQERKNEHSARAQTTGKTSDSSSRASSVSEQVSLEQSTRRSKFRSRETPLTLRGKSYIPNLKSKVDWSRNTDDDSAEDSDSSTELKSTSSITNLRSRSIETSSLASSAKVITSTSGSGKVSTQTLPGRVLRSDSPSQSPVGRLKSSSTDSSPSSRTRSRIVDESSSAKVSLSTRLRRSSTETTPRSVVANTRASNTEESSKNTPVIKSKVTPADSAKQAVPPRSTVVTRRTGSVVKTDTESTPEVNRTSKDGEKTKGTPDETESKSAKVLRAKRLVQGNRTQSMSPVSRTRSGTPIGRQQVTTPKPAVPTAKPSASAELAANSAESDEDDVETSVNLDTEGEHSLVSRPVSSSSSPESDHNYAKSDHDESDGNKGDIRKVAASSTPHAGAGSFTPGEGSDGFSPRGLGTLSSDQCVGGRRRVLRAHTNKPPAEAQASMPSKESGEGHGSEPRAGLGTEQGKEPSSHGRVLDSGAESDQNRKLEDEQEGKIEEKADSLSRLRRKATSESVGTSKPIPGSKYSVHRKTGSPNKKLLHMIKKKISKSTKRVSRTGPFTHNSRKKSDSSEELPPLIPLNKPDKVPLRNSGRNIFEHFSNRYNTKAESKAEPRTGDIQTKDDPSGKNSRQDKSSREKDNSHRPPQHTEIAGTHTEKLNTRRKAQESSPLEMPMILKGKDKVRSSSSKESDLTEPNDPDKQSSKISSRPLPPNDVNPFLSIRKSSRQQRKLTLGQNPEVTMSSEGSVNNSLTGEQTSLEREGSGPSLVSPSDVDCHLSSPDSGPTFKSPVGDGPDVGASSGPMSKGGPQWMSRVQKASTDANSSKHHDTAPATISRQHPESLDSVSIGTGEVSVEDEDTTSPPATDLPVRRGRSRRSVQIETDNIPDSQDESEITSDTKPNEKPKDEPEIISENQKSADTKPESLPDEEVEPTLSVETKVLPEDKDLNEVETPPDLKAESPVSTTITDGKETPVVESAPSDKADSPDESPPKPRGRGRPRKKSVQPPDSADGGNDESPPIRRKRGRPRKYPELYENKSPQSEENIDTQSDSAKDNMSDAAEEVKKSGRGRGRPRKRTRSSSVPAPGLDMPDKDKLDSPIDKEPEVAVPESTVKSETGRVESSEPKDEVTIVVEKVEKEAIASADTLKEEDNSVPVEEAEAKLAEESNEVKVDATTSDPVPPELKVIDTPTVTVEKEESSSEAGHGENVAESKAVLEAPEVIVKPPQVTSEGKSDPDEQTQNVIIDRDVDQVICAVTEAEVSKVSSEQGIMNEPVASSGSVEASIEILPQAPRNIVDLQVPFHDTDEAEITERLNTATGTLLTEDGQTNVTEDIKSTEGSKTLSETDSVFLNVSNNETVGETLDLTGKSKGSEEATVLQAPSVSSPKEADLSNKAVSELSPSKSEWSARKVAEGVKIVLKLKRKSSSDRGEGSTPTTPTSTVQSDFNEERTLEEKQDVVVRKQHTRRDPLPEKASSEPPPDITSTTPTTEDGKQKKKKRRNEFDLLNENERSYHKKKKAKVISQPEVISQSQKDYIPDANDKEISELTKSVGQPQDDVLAVENVQQEVASTEDTQKTLEKETTIESPQGLTASTPAEKSPQKVEKLVIKRRIPSPTKMKTRGKQNRLWYLFAKQSKPGKSVKKEKSPVVAKTSSALSGSVEDLMAMCKPCSVKLIDLIKYLDILNTESGAGGDSPPLADADGAIPHQETAAENEEHSIETPASDLPGGTYDEEPLDLEEALLAASTAQSTKRALSESPDANTESRLVKIPWPSSEGASPPLKKSKLEPSSEGERQFLSFIMPKPVLDQNIPVSSPSTQTAPRPVLSRAPVTARKSMKSPSSARKSIQPLKTTATPPVERVGLHPISPLRTTKFMCLHCKFTSSVRSVMSQHVYSHADIMPYSCGHCSNWNGSRSSVLSHHKQAHQGLSPDIVRNEEICEEDYYITCDASKNLTPETSGLSSPPQSDRFDLPCLQPDQMMKVPPVLTKVDANLTKGKTVSLLKSGVLTAHVAATFKAGIASNAAQPIPVQPKPIQPPSATISESESPPSPPIAMPSPVISKPVTPSPIVTESVTPSPLVTKSVTPSPVVSKSVTPIPVTNKSVAPSPVVANSLTPSPVVTKSVSPTTVVTNSVTPSPAPPLLTPATSKPTNGKESAKNRGLSQYKRPRIPLLDNVDPNQPYYQCRHCTHASNSLQCIKNHVDFMHKGEQCFQCPLCEHAYFKSTAAVEKHNSKYHPNEAVQLQLQADFYDVNQKDRTILLVGASLYREVLAPKGQSPLHVIVSSDGVTVLGTSDGSPAATSPQMSPASLPGSIPPQPVLSSPQSVLLTPPLTTQGQEHDSASDTSHASQSAAVASTGSAETIVSAPKGTSPETPTSEAPVTQVTVPVSHLSSVDHVLVPITKVAVTEGQVASQGPSVIQKPIPVSKSIMAITPKPSTFSQKHVPVSQKSKSTPRIILKVPTILSGAHTKGTASSTGSGMEGANVRQSSPGIKPTASQILMAQDRLTPPVLQKSTSPSPRDITPPTNMTREATVADRMIENVKKIPYEARVIEETPVRAADPSASEVEAATTAEPVQSSESPPPLMILNVMSLAGQSEEDILAAGTQTSATGTPGYQEVPSAAGLSLTAPVANTQTSNAPQLSEIFSCKFCEKICDNIDDAITHIGDDHKMRYWYACPYCPFGCSRHKSKMLGHIARAHQDESDDIEITITDEDQYFTRSVGLREEMRAKSPPIEIDDDLDIEMVPESQQTKVEKKETFDQKYQPQLGFHIPIGEIKIKTEPIDETTEPKTSEKGCSTDDMVSSKNLPAASRMHHDDEDSPVVGCAEPRKQRPVGEIKPTLVRAPLSVPAVISRQVAGVAQGVSGHTLIKASSPSLHSAKALMAGEEEVELDLRRSQTYSEGEEDVIVTETHSSVITIPHRDQPLNLQIPKASTTDQPTDLSFSPVTRSNIPEDLSQVQDLSRRKHWTMSNSSTGIAAHANRSKSVDRGDSVIIKSPPPAHQSHQKYKNPPLVIEPLPSTPQYNRCRPLSQPIMIAPLADNPKSGQAQVTFAAGKRPQPAHCNKAGPGRDRSPDKAAHTKSPTVIAPKPSVLTANNVGQVAQSRHNKPAPQRPVTKTMPPLIYVEPNKAHSKPKPSAPHTFHSSHSSSSESNSTVQTMCSDSQSALSSLERMTKRRVDDLMPRKSTKSDTHKKLIDDRYADDEAAKKAFSVFNLKPPKRRTKPAAAASATATPPGSRMSGQPSPVSIPQLPSGINKWRQFQSTNRPSVRVTAGGGFSGFQGAPPGSLGMAAAAFQQAHLRRTAPVAARQSVRPQMSPATAAAAAASFMARPPQPVPAGLRPPTGHIPCPYCAYEAEDADAIHDHILAHEPEIQIQWSCPYCPLPNRMSKPTVTKHIQNCHPKSNLVYIPFGVPLQ